ncbi:MAG: Hsp20/alpha crystallin family protein [Chloroflexota bacterium]|nr:MAG: Hsp20/alpha crystallin family protein [Chloroflexota bacterium]
MSENTMELEKKEEQALAENVTKRVRRTVKPRIDLYEAGDEIVLLADMPGVNESDIEITLEKDRLTIRGPIEERAPEGYRAVYSEFCLGDYERSFVVSNEIDRDNIVAAFDNGVLRLSLPKAEAAKTRKIVVQSAA